MNNISHILDKLEQADALLITAGAGMGIDSGLPDFRDEQGFWRAFPPLEKWGLHFEEMATPELFWMRPELAWGFYGLRLNSYRATVPHDGFQILQKWAKNYPLGASNVDGQFQKAGFSDERVVEWHGSIHRLQCMNATCNAQVWSAHQFRPQVDESRCELTNAFPRCPHCGSIARPNTTAITSTKTHTK